MKKLGIIGGLGPLATAYFMERLVSFTQADFDQEHINSIVFNCPEIPDRTGYLLGRTCESPVVPIVKIAKILESLKADLIAIPCITVHGFFEEISREIRIPIINMLVETADYLKKNQIKAVGLLATDGTVYAGFFQKILEDAGIQVLLPTPEDQEMIMNIIYKQIKSGKPVDSDKFIQISKEMTNSGAQRIILGCTELSLLRNRCASGKEFVDPLELLAIKAIELSGGRLKDLSIY
ncbi:cysteate racemase [Alkalibacter mobilis]|uniref:aspartate/glutamate racemase family protein n=1 Tax=Alkalibacter mobilis TaxID=2787712 RepID=UPI0018A0F06E|nr:amino acid racemase [Alkalibacter mobilis]MBF7097026.1 amino acid racemase [Alkalibacter mobilis]